jgi:hypothetical protein
MDNSSSTFDTEDQEASVAETRASEKKRAAAWAKRDVGIEYTGTKITLPEDPSKMPIRTAIAALERKAKDEEQELNVVEIISAYPEDALVAFNRAMQTHYGWASPTPIKTFFGEIKPQMVTVQTGPKRGDTIQVPFGQFTLPGVENPIQVHRHADENGPCLAVTGTVRKREQHIVKRLCELAREILVEHSIYKGQAIRLRTDTCGNLDLGRPPEFIDTDPIKPDELVLNPIELDLVKAALWAPIEHTEACQQHGIPLNRGVLLEGIYGTGKTMTASVTSKVCVDNGWTYILLDDVRGLKEALLFAQRYQPAVVFAEDVDRVADKRDQAGNDLLNTIDGVLSKNSQVITVLTTNHVDRLDKAMLRPGRLDAVISVQAPGPEAVERLMRIYGRKLIAPKANLKEAADALAGNIPATIREVVERSKLAMIANGRTEVAGHDLLVAAQGMAYHLDLLKDKPKTESLEHQLGASIIELVAERATGPIKAETNLIDRKVDALMSYHDLEI